MVDPHTWQRLGDPRIVRSEKARRDARHMADKVRALSYRIPLVVVASGRVMTYSISGWARF